MTRRLVIAAAMMVGLAAMLVLARQQAAPAPAPGVLPARLTDQEFWRIVTESSEPGGYFRAQDITNLTSNEMRFQEVIPDLVSRAGAGGVYLGVGPEQNYTYMAALKPRMAIIFDIRRGNLNLQLMYKALFELSADRAEFISRLFAKPRPAGLSPASTVDQLFAAFGRVPSNDAFYRETASAIQNHLTKVHHFPLGAEDARDVDYIYRTFVSSGFAVRASPTYADLMTATDARGVSRSYLASEDYFQTLKAMETKNLVVPVVGNFGGPKAIRAVGAWLRNRSATVSAFYLSNVEQYLRQDGLWTTFCRNVASLPLTPSSTFIRSASGGGGGFGGGGFISSLGAMAEEVRVCR